MNDFMRPDHASSLGAEDDQAIFLMKACTHLFQRNHEKLLIMDLRSAEAHQVCGQRHAGHPDQLHGNELALLSRIAGGRHRALVRQGIGSVAHRTASCMPVVAMEWVLLPQGCEGPDPAPVRQKGTRCACSMPSRRPTMREAGAE